MDVDALRFVLTLAEELHFGRSAARHFISEGQFGRRVRQLEADLGTQLFTRSSRRVEVTVEGLAVLARTRRVLQDIDGLRQHSDSAADGTVSVGVLGFGIGERWRGLRDLVLSSRPGITLSHQALSMADQYHAVLRREVDVALVQYLGEVDGLDMQVVMETPRVAVVPATSPFARARRIGVDEVEGFRWLRLAGADERFHAWAGPLSNLHSGAVASLDTVTTAVATTGFSCVHGAVAARFYAHPDVRFVPLEGAPVVTAVATRRDDDRPIVQAFRAAARHMATVDPAGSEGRSLPSSHMIAPPGR